MHTSCVVMAARGKMKMIDIIDMSISDEGCHHLGNKYAEKFLINITRLSISCLFSCLAVVANCL